MADWSWSELFLQLMITACVYSAFPLVFAALRKSEIKKRTYIILCVVVDMVMYFFVYYMYIIRGYDGAPSYIPLVLWTTVGYKIGKKLLRERGVLVENEKPEKKKEASEYEITSEDFRQKPW